MLVNQARQAKKFFSHSNFLGLYREVHDYLPRDRRREFMKSWVINNLLIGSKRRSQLEKKLGCTLPSLINITPTEKCNLSCLGCYALGYNRTREMTIHEINIIVQQARDLGIFLVGILGGEPFLRKDLFRVIEENKDIAFRISTNGTFLDPEIIGALKRCGNLVTFFSLEGFEEETDGWRGPGVYRKVMESMAVLKRERILFGFSALLHKDNVHSVVSHRFLDMMRDAGCKFGLFFPYGPAGDNARYNLRLTENQIAESFSLLDDLSRKYTMLFIMEGYTSPADSDHYVAEKGCRAGVTVNITPEGNVEPCNGIQFYSQNVFEAGLADVFRSPFYMDIFACVRKNDGRCVSMFASKEVLEIVKKDGAKGSYPRSFPTYQNYASCFPNPPRKKIERKRAMKEALS